MPVLMLYTHLMVKKKSELENNMNQEENIIVDKIQDTLSRDKEDEVERLRREIERTRDEINLIKLKKREIRD